MAKKILAFALMSLFSAQLLLALPSQTNAQSQASTLTTDNLGLQYGTPTNLTTQDVRTIAARIINYALGLLGTIAVVLILIGGFKWMTAGGNEDNVSAGKNYIYYGVIGLAIILSAYAIANFVVKSLIGATTGVTQTF